MTTLDESGERVRRTVLGDTHVDRSTAEATGFNAAFQEYVTRAAWGGVWARPGLDLRTRSCLTLAVLTALRCEQELAMHVAAAIRLGVSAEEIREVLLHATAYAGAPAGNAAFAVASRVLADLGIDLALAPAAPGSASRPGQEPSAATRRPVRTSGPEPDSDQPL